MLLVSFVSGVIAYYLRGHVGILVWRGSKGVCALGGWMLMPMAMAMAMLVLVLVLGSRQVWDLLVVEVTGGIGIWRD